MLGAGLRRILTDDEDGTSEAVAMRMGGSPLLLGAMVALAALDFLGAVLAKEWATERNHWLFATGLLSFGALFAVYAVSLRLAELSTVIFGWIVTLQVGLLLLEDQDDRAGAGQVFEQAEERREKLALAGRARRDLGRLAGDQPGQDRRQGGGEPPARPRSTSTTGENGSPVTPRGRQPPWRTRAPTPAVNSASRRVLPTPASPPTTTSDASPSPAAA